MASQREKRGFSGSFTFIGGVILAILVGYVLLQVIWQFMFAILLGLGILVALLNWNAVRSLLLKIAGIYRKNPLMGLLAALLAFFALPFIIVYLAATTLLGFLQENDGDKNNHAKDEEDNDYTPFEEI